MIEQEKNDKESMVCLTPKPNQIFSLSIKYNEEGFLTALATVINDSTTSIKSTLMN